MLWSLLFILLIARLYDTQQTTDLCNMQNINLTDKNASQSSTYNNDKNIPYTADRAFDGNRSTCSHTVQKPNSSWRIDLQYVYNISCISIYNIDHHNANISGAKIYIGNSPQDNGTKNTLVKNITEFIKAQNNVYRFSASVFGRYVTVITPENKLMVLCEVNITGTALEPPFCNNG